VAVTHIGLGAPVRARVRTVSTRTRAEGERERKATDSLASPVQAIGSMHALSISKEDKE
jgi:hypothetical protein